MTSKRLRHLLAATAVLAATVLTAPAAAADDDAGTLRVGFPGTTETLNPFQSGAGWYPWVLTYDYLVGEDLDRLTTSGFAESWQSADDGMTWTYKIWPDLKWSDGEPATAGDAAWTINYLLESIGTPDELNIGWLNTAIVGRAIESAVAVDDQTLVVKTKFPFVDPPRLDLWVLPEHVWKDITPAEAMSTFANEPPTVGTGPWVLVEWKAGQYLRFEPNPYYRGDIQGFKPQIDQVVMYFFDSAEKATQALASNEVDISFSVPATQFEQLKSDPDIETVAATTNQYVYLAFNSWSGDDSGASTTALKDPAFRDALGYALDKDQLVDKVKQGYGRAAHSIVGPGLPAYYDASRAALEPVLRTFDTAQAASKLEAAGYVDSNGDGIREDKEGKPIELRLEMPSDKPEYVNAAQFITEWFAEAGVSLSSNVLERATLVGKLATPADGGGDWDLIINNQWPNAIISDVFEVGRKDSIGSQNTAAWSSEKFEGLSDQLAQAPDVPTRQQLVGELSVELYTQAPYHVLWHNDSLQAYRTDKFEGFVRMPAPDGLVGYMYYPEMTFSQIRPKEASAPSPSAPAPASGTPAAASPTVAPSGVPGASNSTGGEFPAVAVVAVAVLVGAGLLLLIRRQRAA